MPIAEAIAAYLQGHIDWKYSIHINDVLEIFRIAIRHSDELIMFIDIVGDNLEIRSGWETEKEDYVSTELNLHDPNCLPQLLEMVLELCPKAL